MQKLGLNQSLQQKLSPQQIQFIKLLQVPTAELDARIDSGGDDELDINDYLRDDDYSGYKMQGDGDGDEDDREMPMVMGTSLQELLLTQLGYLGLDEKQSNIGKQLIGSIENDGYIRRELDAIVNDLAFSQGIDTTVEEVEDILKKIQSFDPAGIAARNLQECLLLQLERLKQNIEEDDADKFTKSYVVDKAMQTVRDCYEEFTKKHYDKIIKKLDIAEEDADDIKDIIALISNLNPKPGGVSATTGVSKNQVIIPDFILTNNNGKLELALNSRNAPELRISRSYTDMFKAYDKGDKKDKKLKEAVTFVKQKLDAAKWFIDAIKQRQQTLLRTMKAIIDFQYEYFQEGDETKLKPMILKDIATMINMDISTVSRVASSKAVQTDFGIFPLKYFFSEGIATDSGEEVSSREVKQIIKDLIAAEPKGKPLSDDKIEKILNDKGYNIARRTVAKYREQLNIPVARLRKEL
ncbi:MAG: RNA polymerase sigma-54 factor [Cytophagia bacterium]|nr:RNA polymerase sigma-54 factor [Cytophagia bacterium]